ncbi:cysteine--tRNA ligase [Microgenomates group bacterium RIFCSPLOWO2_01_FULL_46_13]|nr:MAG: cysteine--tRNA ligase [Microgenomates group bacterium RIFCSPHIGHO2_01_FULL_45_11]OGV94849.1 MAG: cysteine--tRNA ligase [Microgenomates group bacterium RIFCSPLOWO2_01_FULL_46_13]
MFLYNTLTKKVEDFKPINPPKVGVYACGPTVYDYAHLGHMRKYVGDDILVRTLKYVGFEPKLVMNITDVGHLTSDADTGEDKMEKGAQKHGLNVWDLANKFTQQFFDSTTALNVKPPDIVCKATDHIPEQIELIKKLEVKGYTYKTDDGIYFNTSKFSGYDKLSGMKLNKLKEGARVETNPQKKNQTDFALWKFTPSGVRRQMEWPSPWGKGFPGWHIECSSMSMKYLGEQFDIHTGGIDHVPIHHTNEIAQSEAATGKIPFVRYWVHHAFLSVDGQKMSKSLDNLFTVADVTKKGINPLALRYLYLTTHYRKTLNFTWKGLAAARRGLERLTESVRRFQTDQQRLSLSPEKLKKIDAYRQEFDTAISSDLDLPQALAIAWEVVKSNIPSTDKYDLLRDFDSVFGLNLAQTTSQVEVLPESLEKLVKQRDSLRLAGDFTGADKIRQKLLQLGFVIEDTPTGTKVKKGKETNETLS